MKMLLSVGRSLVSNIEKDRGCWKKRIMGVPCLATHSPLFQLTPEYFRNFRKIYPEADCHEISDVSHFLMMEIPTRSTRSSMITWKRPAENRIGAAERNPRALLP
jgi:hypothetical protein